MTHKDIYTKFMIEYDKANVTSSYPSLTQYEVATILDKAYYAYIAQKVTGNNPRRASFEADVKSVADLQQLVTHRDLAFGVFSHAVMGINVAEMDLPDDFMYYVQLLLEYDASISGSVLIEDSSAVRSNETGFRSLDGNNTVDGAELYYGNVEDAPKTIDWYGVYYSSTIGDPVNALAEEKSLKDVGPYDKLAIRLVPVKLVSHNIAEGFMATPYNMPWVKNPVAYILDNTISAVYDPIKKPLVGYDNVAHLVYIRKPSPFVVKSTGEDGAIQTAADLSEDTKFELSDSSAEEVINLAIIMALENVESPRLNTKLNTIGLES